MNITDEMVSTWRTAWDRSVGAVLGFVDPSTEREAIRVGLAEVAPLIAAQALRSAAEDVRDNDDAHSHGDRCSYGPPGMCDCDRGATFRWLVSRAAGRCGAPDPHRGVDACVLDVEHDPALFHRYAPVEQLPSPPAGSPPPGSCCTRPDMVWEHARDNKDHFRCVGCGGGMTKARATS